LAAIEAEMPMFRPVTCAVFVGALVFTSLGAGLPGAPAKDLAMMAARSLQDAPIPADDDATEADSQPAHAFRITVRNFLNEESFDQLDEIAGNVRAQKSRFTDGAWKLHDLYSALQEPGSLTATDATWNAHFQRLQRWIARNPDSITPRVALGRRLSPICLESSRQWICRQSDGGGVEALRRESEEGTGCSGTV
jgi:hypothetical protein